LAEKLSQNLRIRYLVILSAAQNLVKIIRPIFLTRRSG
jgi:hypothetical protein